MLSSRLRIVAVLVVMCLMVLQGSIALGKTREEADGLDDATIEYAIRCYWCRSSSADLISEYWEQFYWEPYDEWWHEAVEIYQCRSCGKNTLVYTGRIELCNLVSVTEHESYEGPPDEQWEYTGYFLMIDHEFHYAGTSQYCTICDVGCSNPVEVVIIEPHHDYWNCPCIPHSVARNRISLLSELRQTRSDIGFSIRVPIMLTTKK